MDARLEFNELLFLISIALSIFFTVLAAIRYSRKRNKNHNFVSYKNQFYAWLIIICGLIIITIFKVTNDNLVLEGAVLVASIALSLPPTLRAWASYSKRSRNERRFITYRLQLLAYSLTAVAQIIATTLPKIKL